MKMATCVLGYDNQVKTENSASLSISADPGRRKGERARE